MLFSRLRTAPVTMYDHHYCTINFLATGGNDYTNLAALSWDETGILARDAFAAQMRKLGEISNTTNGRLVAVG